MTTVVFDTETTGLVKNILIPIDQQPRIIEFCGWKLDEDGAVIDTLDFLVDPEIKLEPIIVEITGLTDKDLKGKPTWDRWIPSLETFFVDVDRVVAHNLSFDMDMVNNDTLRMTGREIDWPHERICTVEATMFFEGHRLSLQKLHAALFGEGFENAHRARVDVNALTNCYNELRWMGVV